MQSIPVAQKTKARHVGIFDGSRWYRTLWDNIALMGYKIHEHEYKEKTTAAGKEIFIWWDCRKPAAPGESYAFFQIEFRLILLGYNDVKVQKDGKERKMNKGDLEMNFTGNLILDPENRWNKGFSKYLRWFYDRFFFKSKIEFYKTKLYEEMYTIQNEAKAYFNLVRFM
jgi:hypothetical protein